MFVEIIMFFGNAITWHAACNSSVCRQLSRPEKGAEMKKITKIEREKIENENRKNHAEWQRGQRQAAALRRGDPEWFRVR